MSEALPEQTADDRDETGGDWREADDEASRDAWWHGERPPHWE